MEVVNNGSDDRVEVWQLEGKTGWMHPSPVSGRLIPDGRQEFRLGLDASLLDPNVYPGLLRIEHNAAGGRTDIPVVLTVTEADWIAPGNSDLPAEFGIEETYPNPFNGSLGIRFRLDARRFVQLATYDCRGRVAAKLVNEQRERGAWDVVWEARNVPSGVYILQLTAGGREARQKVVLIR
jgi:hypothetical protein